MMGLAWFSVLRDFDWRDVLEPQSAGLWPKEVRRSLLALLTCVCLSGSYMVVSFWWRNLELSQQQIQQLHEELQGLQRVEPLLLEAQHALDETQQRHDVLSSRLITQSQLPALLDAISLAAKDYGLAMEALLMGREEPHPPFSAVPIEIIVMGDFHAAESFTRSLLEAQWMLVLRNFQMDVAKGEVVQLQLSLLAYQGGSKVPQQSLNVQSVLTYKHVSEKTELSELRNPFSTFNDASPLSLPTARREPLEEVDLRELLMLGTLERNSTRWALVKDPSGRVSRIGVGARLGRDLGRVVGISRERVDLVERVQEGSEWKERGNTLELMTLPGQPTESAVP